MITTNAASIRRRTLRAEALKSAGLSNTQSWRRERNEAMLRVDADFTRRQAAAPSRERCCGRCRTPFSVCANKGCSCHG